MNRLTGAVVAGAAAITINTILLRADRLLGLRAEGGGLLKLMTQTGGALAKRAGAGAMWEQSFVPRIHTIAFWAMFHYVTGFGMVVLYVVWFVRWLPGNGWVKGALFSLLPWVINAVIVLPLLGNGFAGSRVLSAAGMAYFFLCNTVFGVVLGGLFEALTKRESW